MPYVSTALKFVPYMVSDVLANIESGLSLSPVRCQAISRTDVDWLSIRIFSRNKLMRNLNQHTKFFLEENGLKYIDCQMVTVYKASVWFS